MSDPIARVLVPVSGSSMDEETVSLACDMARPHGGTVWVLYVIEVSRSLPLDAEVPAETTRGEQVLQRMEKLARPRHCKIVGDIVQARNLGPAILQEAADRDIDLIVASMPYQERYGTPTLGGVVPYLLKHSPCRVLVYREERSGPVPAEAST